MLIKMRESKGFTLVELMIVVAIIGILAAVAVPYYQRYVAKSRLTSLVMPGARSIQNSVSTYFSVRQEFPGANTFHNVMTRDADTQCFNISDPVEDNTNNTWGFQITLDPGGADRCSGLNALNINNNPSSFTLEAEIDNGKLSWGFVGDLPTELGL